MASPNPSADRNLLFGILALQMDFISRDQLVAGMNAWVLDKHKPLGTILREQGALDAEQHDGLAGMVQMHLKKHDNDAEKSLAAVPVSSWLKDQIKSLCHPDFEASFAHIDPHATRSYSVGEVTSAGLRFQILRPHAEGGLGKVSVALDSELHREVALKEIKEKHADHSDSRGRFVLEAEITGGLEHPGIVPVYGLGHYTDGRPFYAMRFIRGDSLKDAIAHFHKAPRTSVSGQPVPPLTNVRGSFDSLEFRQLLGRFVDVCNAIAYAHSRGVLHRDLKPGNIMLGKYGETLVVDWGLAKATGRMHKPDASARADDEATLRPASSSSVHETVAGSAIGTPAFMSPEQAAGRLDLLGPASDIYSLGATLYTLLTNRPPVFGSDTAEVLKKVQRGEVGFESNADYADYRREDAPQSSLRKSAPTAFQIPPALVAVCRKAMALQRDDRYASALALAADIEHWLADEPVSAHGESWSVRAGRWARKHKPAVATAATLLLTTTIGLAIGLYFVNAERNETELARQGEERQRIAAQASEAKAKDEEKNAREQEITAKAAEKKAKEEAELSTAVKNFLQFDLLQLASARKQHREEQFGRLKTVAPDLRISDLVLRAAKDIEGKFADRPLVEAELRWTIGWTLAELGRPKEAIGQFERQREVYTAKLGPEHPDTLRSMGNLASSYFDAGRTQEALKLREETLLLQKAKLGPDHPDTLLSMDNLAGSYAAAGRTQEALKLREETLLLQKAKLGPEHPDTLLSMHNLAGSYAAAGRTQEALKLREETLQFSKAKLGPEHPDTLSSMMGLANSYLAAGRTQEALKLHEETLQLCKAKLGPEHPDTLTSMGNLANSYFDAGRTQEALKLSEETLLLMKAKHGTNHPHTLGSMHNLANSYFDAGRTQEALKLREETLQLRKAKLGPEHPDTLSSMHNLAVSYFAAGRTQEALKLREETLQFSKAKLGPEHPDTLSSMMGLANSYFAAGRTQEALKLFEETLQLCKAKLGPEHPDTLRSMNNLANSYFDAGRTQEALKLCEETLQLTKAKLGPEHPDTLRSMNNLAISYIVNDRPADALAILHETLHARQRRLKAQPGNSLELSNLAWTHGQIGQANQARHDHAAAVKAYGTSVDLFTKLDQAGALKEPYFRGQMNFARQRLALCKLAEQAVNDLDFALKQPAGQVGQLLDLRVRYLLKEKQLAAAVESAAKYTERAKMANELYDAACMYALCAAAAKDAKPPPPDGRGSEKLADEAMALLTRAVFKGYTNAAHMKQDRDLEILRPRPDYQKLLAQMEAKK